MSGIESSQYRHHVAIPKGVGGAQGTATAGGSEEVNNINIQISETNTQKADAQSQYQSESAQAAESQQQSQEEISAIQQEVMSMQAEVASSTENVTSCTQALTEANSAVSEASSNLSSAQANLSAAQSAASSVPDQIEERDKDGNVKMVPNPQKQAAQAKLQEAQAKYQEAEAKYNEAMAKQAQAQADLEAATAELEQIQSEYSSAQEEEASLQEQAAAQKEQSDASLEQAQGTIDELDAQLAELQAQLEAAQAAAAAAAEAAAQAEADQADVKTDSYSKDEDGNVTYKGLDADGNVVDKSEHVESQVGTLSTNEDGSVTRSYPDGSSETTKVTKDPSGRTVTETQKVSKDANGNTITETVKKDDSGKIISSDSQVTECKTDPITISYNGVSYTLLDPEKAQDGQTFDGGADFDETNDFLGSNAAEIQQFLNDDGTVSLAELQQAGVRFCELGADGKPVNIALLDENHPLNEALSKGYAFKMDMDTYGKGENQNLQFGTIDIDGTFQEYKGDSLTGQSTFDDSQELADTYNIKISESTEGAEKTEGTGNTNDELTETMTDAAKSRLIEAQDGEPFVEIDGVKYKADENGNLAYKVGTWGQDSNSCTTPEGMMKNVYGMDWNEDTYQAYEALMAANTDNSRGRMKDSSGTEFAIMYAQETLTMYPKDALETYVAATTKEGATDADKAAALETLKNSGPTVFGLSKNERAALDKVDGVDVKGAKSVEVEDTGSSKIYTVDNGDGVTYRVTLKDNGEGEYQETYRVVTDMNEKTQTAYGSQTTYGAGAPEGGQEQLTISQYKLDDSGERTGEATMSVYNGSYSTDTINSAAKGELDPKDLTLRSNTTKDVNGKNTIAREYYSDGKCTGIEVAYRDADGNRITTDKMNLDEYKAFVEEHPDANLNKDLELAKGTTMDETVSRVGSGNDKTKGTEAVTASIPNAEMSTLEEITPEGGPDPNHKFYSVKDSDGNEILVDYSVGADGSMTETKRVIKSPDGTSQTTYTQDYDTKNLTVKTEVKDGDKTTTTTISYGIGYSADNINNIGEHNDDIKTATCNKTDSHGNPITVTADYTEGGGLANGKVTVKYTKVSFNESTGAQINGETVEKEMTVEEYLRYQNTCSTTDFLMTKGLSLPGIDYGPLTDNQASFVAQQLYNAMAGSGTREAVITHFLNEGNFSSADVTRIMKAYDQLNPNGDGETLMGCIQGDYSGGAEDKLRLQLYDSTKSELSNKLGWSKYDDIPESIRLQATNFYNAFQKSDATGYMKNFNGLTQEQKAAIILAFDIMYPTSDCAMNQITEGRVWFGAEDGYVDGIITSLLYADPEKLKSCF